MLRVGLTGGIASGKSTVSRMLSRRKVPVVDADRIAREVVAPGTVGLAAVVQAFGAEVLSLEGELNRERLAERVFSDREARRRLEAILHPRIIAEWNRRLDALEAEGVHPFAVVDAALLFEAGTEDRFDRVVVVDCEERVQMERLRHRDGLDEVAARARFRAQMPLGEKVKRADWVIDNRGDLEETEAQVDALVAWLGGEKKSRAKRD